MNCDGARAAKSLLSGRVFYGIIASGVVAGSLLASLAAWFSLKEANRNPEAIRIWGDVASDLAIPIAAMMGGTFGGLAGVAVAVLLDRTGVHSRGAA